MLQFSMGAKSCKIFTSCVSCLSKIGPSISMDWKDALSYTLIILLSPLFLPSPLLLHANREKLEKQLNEQQSLITAKRSEIMQLQQEEASRGAMAGRDEE